MIQYAYLVVHLLRTVEHIHHDAESPAKVFGGLSLAGACWAGWRSTHSKVEGLGQGDVASGGGSVNTYIGISPI